MMKKLALSVLCFMLCAFAAFAGMPTPLLVADYDRDGDISATDRDKALAGQKFTIWINDDNDAAGTDGGEVGDTNTDLDDVPGGNDEKDCEDDVVNGRCDLLDFFPVLVDVSEVDDWADMTWKLCSDSANVVFTKLKADKAGDFHTANGATESYGPKLDQYAYKATVSRREEGEAEFPKGFLDEQGRGVFLIEGRALGSQCLTLRGYNGDAVVAEVTMNLDVVNFVKESFTMPLGE